MAAKILLVEPDADITIIVRELLSSTFDVRAFSSTEDAAAVIISEDFDLAIVDVQLPGRSSWDLITAIKAHRADAPVVIYSVHAEDAEMIADARATGAMVVHKSDDPLTLLATVTAVLSSRV